MSCTHRLFRVLTKVAFLLCLLGQGVSHSAGCSWQYEVQFPDGAKGCITDYPISNVVPRGYNQSLKALMGRNLSIPGNRYAVAASPSSNSCPMAVGYATPFGNSSDESLMGGAVTSCNQALLALSREQPASCRCVPIVLAGGSLLKKSDFELHTGLGSSTNAVAPTLAPEPAKAPPSPVSPKPETVASAGPSRSDVEELRAQLQALRAQTEASRKNESSVAPGTPNAPANVAVAPNARGISAHALVIGNSAYTAFGKLPNPRNDARAIAAKLRSFGIEVDLLLDADRGAMVNALNVYQTKAVGKDVNILYYAGHGVQVDGINYLIPTDMRADGVTAGYIKLNGVALNDALDYLPAKTKLVFLDACRDNPASRSLVASRSAGAIGLAPVNTATGTLIAYATKEGATADDGNGANSPYTTALLENLDAQLDIGIVLRKVRQRVMALTSGRQEPWEYGSLMGDQLVLSTMVK